MKALAIALFLTTLATAQCAMCFRNAEAQSRAQAEALNRGILILALPLAAGLATVGTLIYRRRARTI